MILCRVTGDVVSTVKNHRLEGNRLLLLQPVELDGRTPRGPSALGMDACGAGVSDLVLTIFEGSGTRLIFGDDQIPLEATVVAIVDELEVTDPATLVGRSTLEQEREP